MTSSSLGQPLLFLDDGSTEDDDDAALFPGEDSAPLTSAAPTRQKKEHLTYVLDPPFRRTPPRLATFSFLVLSCISSLFTDSDSVPPLELLYPALFLTFVVGTRSKFAAAAGLVPLALCRSIGATDYFRNGLSANVAYGIALVVILAVWGLVLGAAMVQKRAWLDAGDGSRSNRSSSGRGRGIFSHPSISPLVFPILVTALYQLLFRFSPIGAAGNPAMGLAYVPALRQSVSLLGEIFLVFMVGWFGSVFAGRCVGRTSRGHLWFFGVVCFFLYVYGWAREGYGLGVMMQDVDDWPLARAGESPLRVACITRPSSGGNDDDDNDAERNSSSSSSSSSMIDRTNVRLQAGDDLIIWSEFAATERPSPDSFDWSAAGNNTGAIVAMAYGEKTAENKSYNSVELVQAGQSLGRYDKNRPVPVIESNVQAGSELPTPVNATFTPRSTNYSTHGDDERADLNLKVATAICFDFDFPHLLRNARDADLAVGPSWYWASLGRNLWGDNIYRAIEDGFTLIKCADDGITGAVDPYGRTIAALPTMHDSVHLMEVPVQAGVQTIYANGGYMFGWFCVAVCPFVVYLVLYYEDSTADRRTTVGEAAAAAAEASGDYQYLPDTLHTEPPQQQQQQQSEENDIAGSDDDAKDAGNV